MQSGSGNNINFFQVAAIIAAFYCRFFQIDPSLKDLRKFILNQHYFILKQNKWFFCKFNIF